MVGRAALASPGGSTSTATALQVPVNRMELRACAVGAIATPAARTMGAVAAPAQRGAPLPT
jgi:hypothetical protein